MSAYTALFETRRQNAYKKIIDYLEEHQAACIEMPIQSQTLKIYHHNNATIFVDTHFTYITIHNPEKKITYETPRHHTKILIAASNEITLDDIVRQINSTTPLRLISSSASYAVSRNASQ